MEDYVWILWKFGMTAVLAGLSMGIATAAAFHFEWLFTGICMVFALWMVDKADIYWRQLRHALEQ